MVSAYSSENSRCRERSISSSSASVKPVTSLPFTSGSPAGVLGGGNRRFASGSRRPYPNVLRPQSRLAQKGIDGIIEDERCGSQRLAVHILAALEGGMILSKALDKEKVFENVATMLKRLCEAVAAPSKR